MRKYLNILLFGLISSLIISSCNNKDDGGDAGTESIRKEILTYIGNNLIIPNYQDLNTQTEAMHVAVVQFNENPNETSLSNLRDAFKEAYRAWQYTSAFEFGPAEGQLLRPSINTFPTATSQINSNISSGTYNLSAANNLAAKGLPAIDYLIYGGSSDEEILGLFTSDVDAENRKTYLAAVSNDIKNKVNVVYNEWIPSGGNFIDNFINASGTDVGSSFGDLVNELNFDYEIIKNPKIGIPLGKKTLGEKLPTNVEAFYSGISAELALLNIKSVENIYLGQSKGGNNGKGLDDYLQHLNAQYNGGLLSDAIKSQFEKVKTATEQIPDPLAVALFDNTSIVENAYSEIQKGVILLKTDMPSAMGVLITYQDNDGD